MGGIGYAGVLRGLGLSNLSFYAAEPDYSVLLIPAFVVLVFWMGWGAQRSRQRPETQGHKDRRPRVGDRRGVVVLVVSALCLAGHGTPALALNTTALGRIDELLGALRALVALADGAAILADSEKFPPSTTSSKCTVCALILSW